MTCCEVKLLSVPGANPTDVFVNGGSVVGSDLVLTQSNGGTVTIPISGIPAVVDFSALTAQQITDLTQAIDFAQLTAGQITDLISVLDFTQLTAGQCQDILDCILANGTQAQWDTLLGLLDFSQLTPAQCQAIFDCALANATPAQITTLTQLIDFSQLTAQQVTDLMAILDMTQLTAQQCQDIFDCIITNGTAAQFDDLLQEFDFSTLNAAQCQAIFDCVLASATPAQQTALTQLIDFGQLTAGQITDLMSVLDMSQLSATQCQAIFNCILANGTQAQFDTLLDNLDMSTLDAAQCQAILDCITALATPAQLQTLLNLFDISTLTSQQITDLMSVLDMSTLTPTQCQAIADCILANLTPMQVTTLTQSVDFTQLTPQQQLDLCAQIIASCDVATSLSLNGNDLELLDGQGDILSTIDLSTLTATIELNTTVEEIAGNYVGPGATNPPAAPDDGDVHVEVYDDSVVYWVAAGGGFPTTPAAVFNGGGAGVNIYNTDGALTGNRTVDMNGQTITWQNGGPFIIDGKLTVTGLIDPTGLQFTDGVNQSDAAMPTTTIYVTDGTLSGNPAGTLVFKDGAGNYHNLEEFVSDNIITADLVQAANRIQDLASFDQVWNNVGQFQVNGPLGGFIDFDDAATTIRSDNGGAGTGEMGTDTATAWLAHDQAGETNMVSVEEGGVRFDFGATDDLKIDGNAGLAGQVLTSQGPDLPPVWAAGGGDTNYANTNLTADANRTHTWATFDQTESFTSGDFNQNWTNGTVTNTNAHTFQSYNGDILNSANNDQSAFTRDLLKTELKQVDGGTRTAILSLDPTGGVSEYSFDAGGTRVGFDLASGSLRVYTPAVDAATATAGQVLTLINPATGEAEWQTSAAVDTNIVNDSITATNGSQTQSFADTSQTWNNLANWTIDQGLAALPGSYGSTNWDLNTLSVDAIGFGGITSDLDVAPGSVALISNAGTDAGGFTFPGTETRMYYQTTTAAGSDVAISLDVAEIDLEFGAVSDLKINGNAGLAGEVLTSQGPGLPPVWQGAGGGTDTNYALDDLTADASHTHTWAAFSQTENFTNGQGVRDYDNGTVHTTITETNSAYTREIGFNSGGIVATLFHDTNDFDVDIVLTNGEEAHFNMDASEVNISANDGTSSDVANLRIFPASQPAGSEASLTYDHAGGITTGFKLGRRAGDQANQVYIQTNAVGAGGGGLSAGNVLTLVDPTTGEAEWQAGSNPPDYNDSPTGNSVDGDEVLLPRKWHDGKDIYEVVIPLGSIGPGSGTSSRGFDVLVDEIVSIEGYFRFSGDDTWQAMPYTENISANIRVHAEYFAPTGVNGSMTVRFRNLTTPISQGHVIIQYTKQ